jgi:transposase
MSLHPEPIGAVPDETARIARAAVPRGNAWPRLGDELGTIYTDQPFAALFPTHGRPAEAPWRLAVVTVLQVAEGLSDRQAAEAVRARLDWKYLLGVELDDPGLDFSVLSESRARLLAGGTGRLLLETLLAHCAARGWLTARGPQRTDSTHVLAAIRALNRLETVAETLRAALNAVAAVAPAWLRAQVDADWADRYSVRIEESRLPKGQAAREQDAAQVGADGLRLSDAIHAPLAPTRLRGVPAVQGLRQVWVQQCVTVEGHLRLRTAAALPPTGQRIGSPYDLDERFGHKRTVTWDGYRVHATATCGAGEAHLIAHEAHLIAHVDTTSAQVADADRAEPIQAAPLAKGLPPREHFLGAGYVDAAVLVRSRAEHGIEVVGPVRPDISWQARAPDRYDLAHFQIDWANRTATCPQGRTNTAWTPHPEQWGNAVISIKFSRTDCLRCAAPRPLHAGGQFPAASDPAASGRSPGLASPPPAAANRAVAGALSPPRRDRGHPLPGRPGLRAPPGALLRSGQDPAAARGHCRRHQPGASGRLLVRLDAWLRGIPHARTRTSHFAASAPGAAQTLSARALRQRYRLLLTGQLVDQRSA